MKGLLTISSPNLPIALEEGEADEFIDETDGIAGAQVQESGCDSEEELESDQELNGELEDAEEEEYWDEDSELLDLDFPAMERSEQNQATQGNLVMWLLLFFLRLQAKHYLPDAAVNSLLKFLSVFFLILGRYSEFIANMARNFPTSLFHLRKYFGLTEEFKRFIVC